MTIMTKSLALLLTALCCSLFVSIPNARAGGSDIEASDDEAREHGPPFFGEALDIKGMKPLEGVIIRAKMKGQLLPVITETTDEGRFSIRGFGKKANPDDVKVTCSRNGYKLIDLIRRRISKAADAATVIECLFEKP